MNRPNKLHPQPPHATVTDTLVEEALREDLAAAGDITTNAIVPPERQAIAHLVARQPGRLAGVFMAERVFARLDPDLVFESLTADGSDVQYGEPLARLSGDARSILTGERTALNFVGRNCKRFTTPEKDRPCNTSRDGLQKGYDSSIEGN